MNLIVRQLHLDDLPFLWEVTRRRTVLPSVLFNDLRVTRLYTSLCCLFGMDPYPRINLLRPVPLTQGRQPTTLLRNRLEVLLIRT